MNPVPPAASASPARSPAYRRLECSIIALFFLALLVLKGLAIRAYHIDSDEPQHMHVVWGWAHGLVQYRDLFDNHTPLFQMLCAPVFALFPERADIVNVMRWFMFPLCALTLLFTGLIARRLSAPGVAWWAALGTLALPGFFYTAEEFRTDDLWVVFWIISLWLLMRRPFNTRIAFCFGLALGATFATSMKTTMLLLSLLGGAAMLVATWRGSLPSVASVLKKTLTVLAGLIIVPGLLVAYFASQHALVQMYYCVIQHNMLHGLGTTKSPWPHLIRFTIQMTLLALCARWYWRRSGRTETDRQLLFLFGTAALMFGFLFNLWPVVTPQDYLPFYPLLGVLLAVIVSGIRTPWRLPVQTAALLAATVFIVHAHPPFGDETSTTNGYRADALHLVQPDEPIMDAKGETIYRNRSIYYVLELLTLKRLNAGLIPDDIPAQMIATRTCAARLNRLHSRDADFVRQNYLLVDGKLRALGQLLAAPSPAQSVHFQTIIPTLYAVVEPTGAFTGTVDGQPYHGPLELSAGAHTLTPSKPAPQLAVVWNRVLERGFSPFYSLHHGHAEKDDNE